MNCLLWIKQQSTNLQLRTFPMQAKESASPSVWRWKANASYFSHHIAYFCSFYSYGKKRYSLDNTQKNYMYANENTVWPNIFLCSFKDNMGLIIFPWRERERILLFQTQLWLQCFAPAAIKEPKKAIFCLRKQLLLQQREGRSAHTSE